MKKLSILSFLLITSHWAASQTDLSTENISHFCKTGINGMSKTKGISFDYEIVPNYRIRSVSTDPSLGNSEANINISSRYNVDLKAPLFLKDYLKAAIGFKYTQEDFDIVSENVQQFDFHTALASNSFKRFGTSLIILKPFKGNKYLVFRGGMNFKGNYDGFVKFNAEYMTYNITSLLGIKKNENTELGFGITYRVKPGTKAAYPIVMYNHNINNRWGIETLLPLKAKLRYNLSDKTMLFAGADLRSGSYVLKSSLLPGHENEPILFSNTDIRYGISVERQLVSLLWFGVDLGYRTNLNFDFAQTGSGRKDTIIETEAQGGLYANISIFLTPPHRDKK